MTKERVISAIVGIALPSLLLVNLFDMSQNMPKKHQGRNEEAIRLVVKTHKFSKGVK
ncbi:MAG: hypothetical protein ACREAG_02985 [Nitrosopumilaceae archaeon]